MDFFDHVISPDVLWSFLDTRHIKHGSDKKKIWRHLFLWCQLIYAQNLNYFFRKGQMLGLTKSAVGTSTLHLDTMTTSNAGRSISLLTLKDLVLKVFKIVKYKFLLSFVYFWSKWFLITAMLPIDIRDIWDTCTLDRRVAQESAWHVAE